MPVGLEHRQQCSLVAQAHLNCETGRYSIFDIHNPACVKYLFLQHFFLGYYLWALAESHLNLSAQAAGGRDIGSTTYKAILMYHRHKPYYCHTNSGQLQVRSGIRSN